MKTVYRFYVGAGQDKTQTPVEQACTLAWLAKREDFFMEDVVGYDRGERKKIVVFIITHHDQEFIVDLGYKLRAQLNHNGVGLEYDGSYHRLTLVNDPKFHKPSGVDRPYPNYNVRVMTPNPATHWNWCRANEIETQKFINYDGGGFNFNIFDVHHARRFRGFFGQFRDSGRKGSLGGKKCRGFGISPAAHATKGNRTDHLHHPSW